MARYDIDISVFRFLFSRYNNALDLVGLAGDDENDGGTNVR